MDTDSYVQLIFIVLLLLLSAFFSSAETALTTVNRIKIRSLMDEGNKRAVLVAKIIDNSGKMLSAILIGNNIVNIACSALTTTLTIKLWGNYATGIATGVLTIAVLIFGEITPKNIATHHSVRISLIYAPVIYFLIVILTPVIFIVENLSGVLLRLFGINSKNKSNIITEEELRTIVKVSHEEGVIETDEKQIINNLFDFGDATAKDVMVPRIDMTFANVTSDYEEIINLFKDTMFTRIPIYENDADNVIGILNIKDLITVNSDEEFDIKKIMRKPFFTYEQKNTSDLFKEMQFNRNSIAIVLDEYGQTAGMVTTEDLLEEIVGEIRDEYDTDEIDAFTKINDNSYRVDASYKLDDLNEKLGTSFYSEDNDSLGGLVTEKLDRIPKAGDTVVIDDVKMFVERSSPNRAETIIITQGK
ncbi:MAG: hemolysin family protein [Eubacteriales bacterium]|nr:hemolysin family protein [Eubacteriales bacterium]